MIWLPFGKYQCKTLEEVWDQGDVEYLLWLYGQDFVKEKYPRIWEYLDDNSDLLIEDYEDDPMNSMRWFDFLC